MTRQRFHCLARFDYPTAASPLDRLRALRGTGVDTVLLNWPNGRPYAFGWDGRDRYGYAPYERLMQVLLAEEPGLRFILSFGSLHGAPYYWGIDHPEELAVFHIGYEMQAPSLASQRWLADSSEAARRMAEHFNRGEWADRVIGFLPFSTAVDWHGVGETQVNIPEKETPKTMPRPLEGDFSRPMQQAFREYLEEQYGTEAALRAAWREPGVTFAAATLPTRIEVRSPTPRVQDYFACYNRLNARQAIAWCEALKRGAPDKLAGLGHGFVYGWPNRNLHPQGSGHNAPGELLASPAVDFLISGPAVPMDRLCPLSQHAIDSVRLHGKQQVHVAEAWNLAEIEPDRQLHELTLAAGYAGIRGSAFALGEPRQGTGSMMDTRERWTPLPCDHDAVRERLARLRAWHAAALDAGAESVADLAVFISPSGCYRRAMETEFGRVRIEAFRNEVLNRVALPFDEYHAADFSAVADRYKAWLFLDAPDLDAAAWARVSAEPDRALFATTGEPITDPVALRAFVRLAGGAIWCDSDDTLFANTRGLVFAARTAGRKAIRLPRPLRCVDALTGETLSEDADVLAFDAAGGEVRLIDFAE